MDEDEIFYNEEIAPVLMELANRCDARGLQFLSPVQISQKNGTVAHTFLSRPGRLCMTMKMVEWAMECLGNTDDLIMKIRKDAKDHGHNSVFLKFLESFNG